MDPAVEQKLIEMSVNIAQLNGQMAGLLDVVGSLVRHWERSGAPPTSAPMTQVTALVDSMDALVRHWERFQLTLQQQAQVGGVMPGPGQGGGF